MHLRARLLGSYLHHTFSRLMHFQLGAPVSLPDASDDNPDVLYIHIPFCESLCPFCSFHRVLLNTEVAREYFRTLHNEIKLVAEKGYKPTVVYVGGGTPTILPDELESVLTLVHSLFPVRQISVETNPNHLNAEVFSHLKTVGVNRVSTGIQTFDDSLLNAMGRYDSYGSGEQIAERILFARDQFDTVNADMIFNLPNQSKGNLQRDLHVLTDELKIDQISYYPLMTSTYAARKMKNSMGASSLDNEETYYDMIRSHFDTDYQLSSVWCFSRDESMVDEYIIADTSYIGVGSGAFSYLNGTMYSNSFSLKRYGQFIAEKGSAMTAVRKLSISEQAHYDLVMTLFGQTLDKDELNRKYDGRFSHLLWKELELLNSLGSIRDDDRTIKLTRQGQYDWLVFMREFFIGVDNFRDEMRHHVSAELSALNT